MHLPSYTTPHFKKYYLHSHRSETSNTSSTTYLSSPNFVPALYYLTCTYRVWRYTTKKPTNLKTRSECFNFRWQSLMFIKKRKQWLSACQAKSTNQFEIHGHSYSSKLLRHNQTWLSKNKINELFRLLTCTNRTDTVLDTTEKHPIIRLL